MKITDEMVALCREKIDDLAGMKVPHRTVREALEVAISAAPTELHPITTVNLAVIVDAIMEQAQVFASTYSLVGGRFDDGTKYQQSEDEKAELRRMIKAATEGSDNG